MMGGYFENSLYKLVEPKKVKWVGSMTMISGVEVEMMGGARS